ncbi:hypothetical protein EGR_06552 [Echinococcus granulosus]|uniref:Uncharacterized protein n=1 Tax=Echinococcus granulosus TaxID=6210 RepID=W6UBS5_ECHGR|nr:hypothetical protein EGR_06552 [Echinococcus granulosus]EUB58565.1 hypothetical protein EGR_06552 [Echinococcus granulosus]
MCSACNASSRNVGSFKSEQALITKLFWCILRFSSMASPSSKWSAFSNRLHVTHLSNYIALDLEHKYPLRCSSRHGQEGGSLVLEAKEI